MSFLTKEKNTSKIGKVIRISDGCLKDKYAMIAKVFTELKDGSGTVLEEAGYGVIVDNADWPAQVPTSFNAIFVKLERVVELSEEEQTLLKIKFPNSDQFE